MRRVVLFLAFSLVISSNAFAVSVNAIIKSIKFNGKEYVITGHVSINGANQGGLPERDTVIIFMDVLGKGGGKFPVMPDSYSIANGKYIAGKRLLSKQEAEGVNCKTYVLWKWNAEAGAWHKGASELNGRFHYDASKVPSHYEKDFKIGIDRKFASNFIRIRVHHEHIIGGPFANWPGFIFKHQVLYQGLLKNISMSKVNKGSYSNSYTSGSGVPPKGGGFNNPIAIKYKKRLKEIIRRHRIKVLKVKTRNGKTREIISKDGHITIKDKTKYYGGKAIGWVAGKIPGVKYVSNKVQDKANTLTGLDKVKQTRMDLGVNRTEADLYNKMCVFPEREKRFATALNFIKSHLSPLTTPISYVIDGAGKATKVLVAKSYEVEYKEVINRIKKNNGNIGVVKKDIENDGYISYSTDAFGHNISDIASRNSRGEYKDPVKRMYLYIKLAKMRGDL